MISNRTLWTISGIILLVCVVMASIFYIYFGELYIAILIATPVIHWVLRQKQKGK
jgi:hypothetical protein